MCIVVTCVQKTSFFFGSRMVEKKEGLSSGRVLCCVLNRNLTRTKCGWPVVWFRSQVGWAGDTKTEGQVDFRSRWFTIGNKQKTKLLKAAYSSFKPWACFLLLDITLLWQCFCEAKQYLIRAGFLQIYFVNNLLKGI